MNFELNKPITVTELIASPLQGGIFNKINILGITNIQNRIINSFKVIDHQLPISMIPNSAAYAAKHLLQMNNDT